MAPRLCRELILSLPEEGCSSRGDSTCKGWRYCMGSNWEITALRRAGAGVVVLR